MFFSDVFIKFLVNLSRRRKKSSGTFLFRFSRAASPKNFRHVQKFEILMTLHVSQAGKSMDKRLFFYFLKHQPLHVTGNQNVSRSPRDTKKKRTTSLVSSFRCWIIFLVSFILLDVKCLNHRLLSSERTNESTAIRSNEKN